VPSADSAAHGRRGRLSRSRDFDAVYRHGRSSAGRHLVVYVFTRPAPASDAPRLGLSVSKKVGGAVERNRVKRVLREQFAAVAHRVPADADVVVIARPGIVEHLEQHGSAAVGERLAELLGRLTPAPEAGPDVGTAAA
jgi:ribonuclease P protein component